MTRPKPLAPAWYKVLSHTGRLLGCATPLPAAKRLALATGGTLERLGPGGYPAALTAIRRANGAAKPHERRVDAWEPERWKVTGVGRMIQGLRALAELAGDDGVLLGDAVADADDRCRIAHVLKRGGTSRYGLRVDWDGERLGAKARVWATSEDA